MLGQTLGIHSFFIAVCFNGDLHCEVMSKIVLTYSVLCPAA